jgi:hypothetical protein
MTEQKRSLSLSDVREQLAATHRRLVAFIQNVREHQLISDTRFLRRLRLDTYRHYPIHAEAIRQWRQAAGRRPGMMGPPPFETVVAMHRATCGGRPTSAM